MEISNLRPICSNCNRSMETKNMEEFIEYHGFKKIKHNADLSKTITSIEKILEWEIKSIKLKNEKLKIKNKKLKLKLKKFKHENN